ncbi:NAD(P)-binding protein [Lentinula raphanica]|nr:NAD(P)-binding protein [Lentinula raphanica]
MGNIPDEILTQHHVRLEGKTAIVTGAGASIGRATAILFASYGSNVIVSDKNISSAEETVSAIKSIKGESIACRCDVTVWEDIVAMYELAVRGYGSVDIVETNTKVANAGVGEIGGRMMHDPRSGRPTKPLVTTIDVNLTGVLYTVHLAQHYLEIGRPEDPSSMKCVILVGSMASWTPLSKAPIYTASKHAVLAIMRSLDVSFASRGIRIASIHPFFAGRHNLQSVDDCIPLTPVPRIAGAILYAASQPDPSCNGAAFWIPDGGASTFMISREEFKPGIYDYIDSKSNATSVYVTLV